MSLLVAMLLLPLLGFSQYTVDATIGAGGFTDLTSLSGTSAALPFADDEDETVVTLPFDFILYGTTYEAPTPMTIGFNGAIGFNTSTAEFNFANTAIPVANTPNAFLPFYDDLDEAIGWNIFYTVQGDCPNRVAIIQYNLLTFFAAQGQGVGEEITFQVKLFEGTNEIQFLYPDVEGAPGDVENFGGSATIGIQGVGGSNQFSFNTQSLTNNFGISFDDPSDDAIDLTLPPIDANLSCNGLINITLDDACQAVLIPEMVLGWNY